MKASSSRRSGLWLLLVFLLVTTTVYWPGLSGGFLFDDYPNIVDNNGVQPHDAGFSSLIGAALSSPASDFKRPLATLSFAVNFLASGLDPYWMKLTNLVIHLLNGLLVFLLASRLLEVEACKRLAGLAGVAPAVIVPAREYADGIGTQQIIADESAAKGRYALPDTAVSKTRLVAVLIAASWMLLPINLTGVLYVVQRMESMANLFVLLGLIGYVAGRRRMLASLCVEEHPRPPGKVRFFFSSGFLLCLVSLTVPVAVGVLAKETAVMLPLYALLIEWILFGFQRPRNAVVTQASKVLMAPRRDCRIISLFLLLLALPMVAGLVWLLPGVFNPEAWASRDFTLTTRLLSESRIIVNYIAWTLLPTPDALSFYHDDFHISTGLLTPWTTLVSMLLLGALIALMLWLRRRRPLTALGIALFLGCHLLTGTILPLELIYEHRNYFASFGLLLAIVPLLAASSSSTIRKFPAPEKAASTATASPPVRQAPVLAVAVDDASADGALPMALPRYALLAGLMLCWTALTAFTAYAWGNPLRLAEDLVDRGPQSPRAQYELGRTYIIYSRYDPASPFTQLAYAPLERSAALPNSSILPEQALIFMNARMGLPLKDAWWDSMIAKLKAHQPAVQDESSLGSLTQCVREHHCDLPKDRMMEAFLAALTHPDPSARLLATYGDYAWNVLDDHGLGLRMTEEAVKARPNEPAYRITLIRMFVAQGRADEARQALKQLQQLNTGGRLDNDLQALRAGISNLRPG